MPTSILIEQFVLVNGDTLRTASGNSLTISLNHLTIVTRKKYLTKMLNSTAKTWHQKSHKSDKNTDYVLQLRSTNIQYQITSILTS